MVFNFSLEEELNRQAGLLGTLLTSLPDYALAHTVLQICNKFVFLCILCS